AYWIFADRFVAVDHRDRQTYLVALSDGSEGSAGPETGRGTVVDDVSASRSGPPPPARPVRRH
ncbi:hypothetical protein AB0K25_16610, partial [Micromonospora sp. NPDC049257]|uniref:hypothetical protein n=1 Tax=Micromonospora sp. NPDC049257 TaxID=3155771 RepID=UPI0034322513